MKKECPARTFCLSLESSLGWWRHGAGWSCVRVCELENKCVMFLRLSVNGPFRSHQKPLAPLCPPLSVAAIKPRFTDFYWVAAEIFKEMKLDRNISVSSGLFTPHCGSENAWWERPFLPVHILCVPSWPWDLHQSWWTVLLLKVTDPHSWNQMEAQGSKKQFNVTNLFASRNVNTLLVSLLKLRAGKRTVY